MNKFSQWLLGFIAFLCPLLGLAADSAMSFTPPASDYSVVFLGNIFGVVDGVLHGSGSQMLGSMFAVFNAAVLAIGGVIIMYTLIVSTMNTAHEGQMLGQKWSSIWIPVRSTIGLALLIPKASGYCLMQIFVMWLVVQGVGAADKVWDAALNYLNRGGVIIRAQTNPAAQMASGGHPGIDIAKGAQSILASQVCMAGLQKGLELTREAFLQQGKTGPCGSGVVPGTPLKAFCDANVPDLITSVNAVKFQSDSPHSANYTLPMPNTTVKPYDLLTGICGRLHWNALDLSTVQSNMTTLSSDDLDTAKLSRAIAIQQMYSDLAMIAQVMIGNVPAFQQYSGSSTDWYSPLAVEQFGVPQTASGVFCPASATDCTGWGPGSSGTSGSHGAGSLFNGSEFQNALSDYNNVMFPTLNLIYQANNNQNANAERQFIQGASANGWIMAGSYFFDLVRLNQAALPIGSANAVDSNTGLDGSSIDLSLLTAAFPTNSGATTCSTDADPQSQQLCNWFNANITKVNAVVDTIKSPQEAMAPTLAEPMSAVNNPEATTVYGYTNNAMVLRLPGQPGQKPLQFANILHINFPMNIVPLQKINFACGEVTTFVFSFCLGSLLGNVFFNNIFFSIINMLYQYGQMIFNQMLSIMLVIPLSFVATVFKDGLDIIDMPGVNPIVALANMGTYYINFVGNLWKSMVLMSLVSMIPGVGLIFFALSAFISPFIMAFTTVMVGVGIVTAYYVPILPYMMFLFGSIAWLMAVIEAMVAAPIVALGVTHPEGNEAFGKGEPAIMILLNVFLRPSMMIIGYIAAISLSYVGTWILNAGFDHAISFMQGPDSTSNGYNEWAGILGYFMAILIYTSLYLTIVQRSFTLISLLPDQVLRWIGGHPESHGQQAAQWGDEAKGKIESAGKDVSTGMGQSSSALAGKAQELMGNALSSKPSGGKMSGKGGGGGGAGGGGAGKAAGAAKVAG